MAHPAHTLGLRIGRLVKGIRSAGLRGVVIAPGPNLTYYTGVAAHLYERPFMLFVGRDGGAHLLAPRLEAGPFRDSVPMSVHAWTDNQGPSAAFREVLAEIGKEGKWGCDGRVPFAFLNHLLVKGLMLKPADEVLQSVREVKEPGEVELLKRSAAILSRAVMRVPETLKEGATEREVALSIREAALEGGADEVDPTVQSGPRAADPHSATSERKVRRGESVVVDVVSSYGGYAADITRTFVVGRGAEVERTYRSVLSAQRKAIAAARSGAMTGEVDSAARGSLTRDGLGTYFIHRTGHGLGLEVHEAPYIVAGGRERLKPGMAFTVEPGAYIPGKLGVRIEDDVVISERGHAVVTTSSVPKDYGWWR
ncbi:MAG: aminopeptidase P family protein [Nitrososphaerota archaeon]|nr:aminopeptidase P family protein [Nitrososphaerota archaeon]MDG6978615.1 aminopeptidase P family protein [Nitrososphaerota archaeon]MDG7020977.1 aminopeptidase P family protein [Nitrososphaerota archaeon]MDG7022227.1 aminopeptidase P family protein [Nitrososphaerota archaeon]